MIQEHLERIIASNREAHPLYVRSLLKEVLQAYILNYMYTSKYATNLLFTGGTCLRVCFDLPRLSEDIDLDVKDSGIFNMSEFEEDIGEYFRKELQYKDILTKIDLKERRMFLKFPILASLGLKRNSSESDILFVRIDFSPVSSLVYTEELSLKTTATFSFIINRYSLPDLFASKIVAILQRTFVKGESTFTFKGRDYFDLLWFLEHKVVPNFARIADITHIDSKEEVLQNLNRKVENLNEAYLREDLIPFFKDQAFITSFTRDYKQLYTSMMANAMWD